MSEVDDKDKQNNPNPDDPKDDNKGKDSPKTFTQEELDKQISERLKREREQSEKTIADKLKKEREEWERQAKLSAEEKEAEERKKREQEIADEKRDITLRENRADARELLQEKKIPTDLVDFVVDIDPDKTKKNIDSLEKAFTKAVEEGVESKLSGKTPTDKSKTSTPTKPQGGTRVL